MPTYLIFDTETTGLPLDWKAPLTDLDNWPRLVQLAWQTHDEQGRELAAANRVVKPEGFDIPAEAAKVHRITNERARAEGRPLREVLGEFHQAVRQADALVAHNIEFDRNILGAEYLRTGLPDPFEGATQLDTMRSAIHLCKLPGPRGQLKPPTLAELYHVLFSEHFEEAHDAAVDVRATVRCFFEMMDFGLFEDDDGEADQPIKF